MCACLECGQPVPERKRQEAVYCSSKCRAAFNNRRMKRGAELYDLFMSLRYDRENARLLGVWGFICRLGQLYRENDIVARGGRRSWIDPKEVMDRKPWLRASVTRISA